MAEDQTGAVPIENIPNQPDIKPGIQTSEFIGKTVVQIVTLAATAGALYKGHAVLTMDQQAGIVKSALAVIGGLEALYTASRTIVKSS